VLSKNYWRHLIGEISIPVSKLDLMSLSYNELVHRFIHSGILSPSINSFYFTNTWLKVVFCFWNVKFQSPDILGIPGMMRQKKAFIILK